MSDWFERFGFARVGDGLLAGAYPLDAADVLELAHEGVDIVYNLCEDEEYEHAQREAVLAALSKHAVAERRLPLEDYGGVEAAALQRAVDEVLGELSAGRTVYLHCRAGWQRSAVVAAAVIAVREGISPTRALAVLAERKPTSEPLPHQRANLFEWWQARGD